VSTREAESKVIGRTPLTVATSDVPKGVDDGPVLLEVSKEGFQAKTLLLPNLPGSSLSFELVLEPREGLDYRAINRILAIAFQAERDLLQKRFEETLKGAESLKAINPNLAIAYQLEGSVSFLKGDLEKSRHAWRRALELNPEDPEARNMLNAIEKDSPSETAPAKSTP
jgi:tetratricopeptide (TPR) repeat protein